jgi:hypothetical protein
VDAEGNSALYLEGKLVASARRTFEAVNLPTLLDRVARVRRFHQALVAAGLPDTYEATHARLAVNCLLAAHARAELLAAGKLPPLPVRSRVAADKAYLSTTAKLCDGLEKTLNSYKDSDDSRKKRLYGLWRASDRS